MDMEKLSGAGFKGLNTKAGDLPTVNFRGCNVTVPDGSSIATCSIPTRDILCSTLRCCVKYSRPRGRTARKNQKQ